MKKHIERMIEKINESNVLSEKYHDDVDETIKMKYLLNNERFYFEKSKFQQFVSTIKFIISEIFLSRLRKTNTIIMMSTNSEDLIK